MKCKQKEAYHGNKSNANFPNLEVRIQYFKNLPAGVAKTRKDKQDSLYFQDESCTSREIKDLHKWGIYSKFLQGTPHKLGC